MAKYTGAEQVSPVSLVSPASHILATPYNGLQRKAAGISMEDHEVFSVAPRLPAGSLVARIIHESAALTVDMTALPGVLGSIYWPGIGGTGLRAGLKSL